MSHISNHISKTMLVAMVAGGLAFTGGIQAQGLAEFGAVAGGAAAGGAAGKALNDALSTALGNLDKQTAQAAGSPAPALDVGPAQAKTSLQMVAGKSRMNVAQAHNAKDASGPESYIVNIADVSDAILQWPTPPEVVTEVPSLSNVLPNPAPLPPPEMTPEIFKTVTAGMNRTDLLRLGYPSYKVTMDEDGHLVEIYSYQHDGARIGSIRLTDGAVASAKP